MNVCSFEFVRVVAGGLFGNIMPVYLDQLGQRVGALFFLVMERRDPAEPSESVNCTIALLRHALFFFFTLCPQTFEFVPGPELLCCTQRCGPLELKDVMSCPHMKVVWGGGEEGRGVGMEMQSD